MTGKQPRRLKQISRCRGTSEAPQNRGKRNQSEGKATKNQNDETDAVATRRVYFRLRLGLSAVVADEPDLRTDATRRRVPTFLCPARLWGM